MDSTAVNDADEYDAPLQSLPYKGVTRETLNARWVQLGRTKERCRVIGFHKENEDYGYFSNWYIHEPYMFEVPEWCRLEGLPTEVPCAFAEKAIMLCKAGTMGDAEMFVEIIHAKTPKEAKQLGWGIQHFDETIWDQVVCSVGFEVVVQKFGKLPVLGDLLLQTQEVILAEAASHDTNWGIGLGSSSSRLRQPDMWCGANILGWALMEARTVIRREREAFDRHV
eukprot:TRINITY_DN56778_c0_g1_i1.p1 TRINITY_DN56778_c0_g1~~TRINITY_DN56778_c0_g1_i1.p1  ORF type:complete len:224 (+),score=37.13 TRINITY_DN56778_c0_g1_i1:109-780(+)